MRATPVFIGVGTMCVARMHLVSTPMDTMRNDFWIAKPATIARDEPSAIRRICIFYLTFFSSNSIYETRCDFISDRKFRQENHQDEKRNQEGSTEEGRKKGSTEEGREEGCKEEVAVASFGT